MLPFIEVQAAQVFPEQKQGIKGVNGVYLLLALTLQHTQVEYHSIIHYSAVHFSQKCIYGEIV